MRNFGLTGNANVKFICLNCGETELIPRSIVTLLDGTDLDASPNQPPQFTCEVCGGVMYPENYQNQLGYRFRIGDVQSGHDTN